MTVLDSCKQEDCFKIEENFRFKNWKNLETLNTIVVELKETEKTYESFDLSVKLNLDVDNTAVVLRNIFGSKEPLAHVIIDESPENAGGIFSSDLVQEAKSSEQCCQKISRIFESSDEKVSNLPIVIVTGSKSGLQMVLLLPSSFQIPRLTDSMVVYMIDPVSGNTDICQQTQNKLLFKYLNRGSEATGLKHVFKNLSANQKDHLPKSTVSHIDSAYLCIMYCLFVLNDGNDDFISAEWPNILKNFHVKKAALINRIESFIAKRDILPQSNVSVKLDKLYQTDLQIEQIMKQNLLKIKNEKIKFEQNSTQSQLGEMIKLEKILLEKNEKLRIQIKETEKLISDHLNSESSIELSGKSLTIEKKYKQFITGEERRRIEADEQKKIQSIRSNLMDQNDKESRKIFEDQIEALMVLKRSKEEEIFKLESQITCLSNDEKKLGEKIAEKEKAIKNCEIDLASKTNSKNLLLINKNNSLIKAQSFNGLSIDNNPTKWIIDVLNLNIYSNQNELNALKNELDNITNNINNISQNIKNLENDTNKLLTKREQLRVEINELNNEVSDLSEEISEEKSNLVEKKKEKDSYDTILWRNYYFTKFNSLGAEVAKIEKNISSLKSDLDTKKSSIKKNTKMNDDLVKNIEKNLQSKACLSKSLEKFSNKTILEQLKKIKNFVVNQFSEEQNIIQNQINNTELVLNKIQSNISFEYNQVKIERDQIAYLSGQKDQIRERIQLICLKKNQLQDQINKIKQNLNNSNDPAQKLQAKIARPVNSDSDPHISSTILTENELRDLISLVKFKDQKWYLMYRGSRDGFKSENFHQKCGGLSNTLTIIETENKAVFGGFTGACWSKDGGFIQDQYSLIFSYFNTLNKKLIFECSRSLEAIYCQPNSGPSFGYNDLFIANECNKNFDSSSHIGYSYYNKVNSYNSEESKTFLTGSANFKVTEIEVYTKACEKLSQDNIKLLCEKTGKNTKQIQEVYDAFNAVAINGQIKLDLFVSFLIRKNQNIETEKELKEMESILRFVFESFDEDKSGHLDFFEFIQCYFIFEAKNRKNCQKSILEFLFDLADKDKSQSLEIEEINDLLKKFPNILNRNNFASNLKDKVNLSSNKILTKNEFCELLDLLF